MEVKVDGVKYNIIDMVDYRVQLQHLSKQCARMEKVMMQLSRVSDHQLEHVQRMRWQKSV